ncbi:13775_t:CDS:2, partial [Dentiscutata erythropus]
MSFKLTTICLIDSIISIKETNDFIVIEANATARVKKNSNNKDDIFNFHLTVFYNKNLSIPSFIDEIKEDTIYEISEKVNLTEFSKTNEIKVTKKTKISTKNLYTSVLNIYLTGAEDKEYQINCRFLNIDQRLYNKTNNMNENSHLLVCGELTLDPNSQIIVDILDINYLPGYQQKTHIKSTAQLSTTHNWDNSEETYRRSISKIIDKKIIVLDSNEENLALDNNNNEVNHIKNNAIVETKENNNNDDDNDTK